MGVSRKRLRQAFLTPAVLLLLVLVGFGQVRASEKEITVFAAASTTEVVKALSKEFQKRTGVDVTASFAGSSTLAKQIEQGAPANIFISANMGWLEYLKEKGLMAAGSPVRIAANQLVLIVPKEQTVPSPFNLEDLPDFLGERFLAIGNPNHVPVGIYSKATLESLAIWPQLKGRIVQRPNVRAVVTLVERDEVAAGIVYATDARLSKNVKVATILPDVPSVDIVYGLALLKDYDSYVAKQFFDFILSPDGQEIFMRFGFEKLHN